MKYSIIIVALMILSIDARGKTQNENETQVSIPINIEWVKNIPGDFSFAREWSSPVGVDGHYDSDAAATKFYSMLDSNGTVLQDSAEIFYKFVDSTHQYHSIQSEAWCYEWGGTDIINVVRKGADSVFCYTEISVGTHSCLHLNIVKNICYATIDLISIVDGHFIYYCTNGHIKIDELLWKRGIMKAEFYFDFNHPENPEKPMFWRGRIYAKIGTE